MLKWLGRSTNLIATLILGLLLSRWIANLPYEFPPLPGTIAFCMRVLNIDTIDHADDIEAVGLLLIIVASVGIAALPVWLAKKSLHRLELHS